MDIAIGDPESKPSENLPEPLRIGFVRIATGSIFRAIPLYFCLLASVAFAWGKVTFDPLVLAASAFVITCGLMLAVRKGSLLLETLMQLFLVGIWSLAWIKILVEQDVGRLLLVSMFGVAAAMAMRWLRRPWMYPYARPVRSWFEGTWSSTGRLLFFLPGGTPARVHQMTREGAWLVFASRNDHPRLSEVLELRSENIVLKAKVRSLWVLESNVGVGVEFLWDDLTHQRKMTQVIERLRGALFC
jgi:hypothetical protein